MDVRKTFLNGDLVEDVYMSQPISFEEVGKENMVYKLQKSIYGLKQGSRHVNIYVYMSTHSNFACSSSSSALQNRDEQLPIH